VPPRPSPKTHLKVTCARSVSNFAKVMVVDLVSDYSRGCSKPVGEIIDRLACDHGLRNQRSQLFGRYQELRSKCAVALLSIATRSRHDPWMIRRSHQVLEN